MPTKPPVRVRPDDDELLHDAEVREERAVVRADEDVRRLHVAVHEPARVRGIERRCDLRDDAERTAYRQPPLGDEQRLEVAPVDVLHRDVEHVVCLAGVVDRDDARVVERGGEPRLAEEPLAEVGLAERRGEELQCGGAAEPHVLGAVDDARPALADRLDEAVPADLRVDPPVPHRDELYNHYEPTAKVALTTAVTSFRRDEVSFTP